MAALVVAIAGAAFLVVRGPARAVGPGARRSLRPVPAADDGASPPPRSPAAEDYVGVDASAGLELARGLAGWWRAGWGSPGAGVRLVGWLRGWWWVRVVLGVAAVLARRSAGHPAVRRRCSSSGGSTTASRPSAGWRGPATWRCPLGVNVVGTTLGAARRWSAPLAAGGRAWPAVAAGVAAALVLLGSFVYPVLVEPLFNDFTPLPDGSLRTGDPRAGRPRRACTSTTCWSPTPRGVRRR